MSDCRVPMPVYGKPTVTVEVTFDDGSRWVRKVAANGRSVRSVRVDGAGYAPAVKRDDDCEWMNE